MSEENKKAIEAINSALSGISLAPLPLPTFSGLPGEQSFRAYIRRLNHIGNAMNWDEEKLMKTFPALINGPALDAYNRIDLSKTTKWEDILKEMAKNLAGTQSSTYLRQTHTRKQTKNESVQEFILAIQELVDLGYPETTFNKAAKERLTIDFALQGLLWPIKKALLYRETEINTINELISAANKEKDIQAEIDRQETINEIAQNAINSLTYQDSETDYDQDDYEYNNDDYEDNNDYDDDYASSFA